MPAPPCSFRIRHEVEKFGFAILMGILQTCSERHRLPPSTLRTDKNLEVLKLHDALHILVAEAGDGNTYAG